MAQPTVFLSHSSKDASFVRRLEADLQQAGAKVYRVSAQDGGNFQKRIDEALLACEWVVLVLTKDALASSWVEQEIYAANRLKHDGRIKEILPIQAGAVDYRTIPPLWGVFNIFDATHDYESARDALLRAIDVSMGHDARDALVEAAAARALNRIPLSVLKQAFEQGRAAAQENLADAEMALTTKPTDARAWIKKGDALAFLLRTDEALEAYDKAISLDPGNTLPLNNKATALRLKAQVEALEKAARQRGST